MNSTFPFLPHQLAWIQDLKTTTEPQTKGVLFRKVAGNHPVGYCCLGRVCVLEGLEDTLAGNGQGIATYGYHDDAGNDFVTAALPMGVQKKYKLRSGLGAFRTRTPEGHSCLSELNDSAEWTFKQIGEYIEQNPENVFTNLD